MIALKYIQQKAFRDKVWTFALSGYKFVCPIRRGRLATDYTSGYKTVENLGWESASDLAGKTVKLRGCSLAMRLFRLTVNRNRTYYIVTNDSVTIEKSEDAIQVCGFRWKVEQYHREVKQLTGIGNCQARNGQAQRNHIRVSILVWITLQGSAYAKGMTVYQLKSAPLERFEVTIWKEPYTTFKM
ncbi:MAG: hypothetical protein AAF706_00620 [Bacteroidota bacterium]